VPETSSAPAVSAVSSQSEAPGKSESGLREGDQLLDYKWNAN